MDLSPALIWFLVGFVMLIAEFALPGVIIMFFGIGAWITALTTWLGLTPNLTSQNIVFCVSSIFLLFVMRNRLKNIFVGNATNDSIEDEYTGKEALALSEINEIAGKLEIKGAEWNARSSTPIPARSWVLIERREGLTLHVRAR